MKKEFFGLMCLIGLSACSSENVIVDSLRTYEVANSACKTSLSATDTRSNFYEENYNKSATLHIELQKDGIALCTVENVKDNCAVKERHVNVVGKEDQLILTVYHKVDNGGVWADCICDYDVNFKITKLSTGSYHLKVYYAGTDMKHDDSCLAFDGKINLDTNKKKSVALKSDLILPEN